MRLHNVLSEAPAARSSGDGSAWIEGFVRQAIRHAAHKAPASLSERLEEEWLADLSTRKGVLARVRFALGCCRATRVIAHEFGVPLSAAAASADKAPAVWMQTGPAFFSRRTSLSVLVISLHALVIYGLASGMARRVLEEVPERVQVSFTKPTAPLYQPPRPFDVKVQQLHFSISPPDRIPDIDLTPVTIANVDMQPPQLTSSSSGGAKPLNRIMGGPGQGFPNSADYYPDAARRLGEKGTAMVHVCVDGRGRLTADPTIAQSSGSGRLDAGALRLAKAGSGHYRPTTEDGSPVGGCYAFSVRFELRD